MAVAEVPVRIRSVKFAAVESFKGRVCLCPQTWLPGGGQTPGSEQQAARGDADADLGATPGIAEGPDIHAYRREVLTTNPNP